VNRYASRAEVVLAEAEASMTRCLSLESKMRNAEDQQSYLRIVAGIRRMTDVMTAQHGFLLA